MAININWYKALPEQEKQTCRNKLENEHRVAQKLLEQAKKVYATVVEEVKVSSVDIATIIRHLEKCKEEIKELEDDMGKISAYSGSSSYGATTTSSYGGTTTSAVVVCDDRDPYLALNSILANGVVNIRPGDFCSRTATGVNTFQQIGENRKKEKEAREVNRWVNQHAQFSRSTKKEESFEQKEQKEPREQKEQREQREQKEQKGK